MRAADLVSGSWIWLLDHRFDEPRKRPVMVRYVDTYPTGAVEIGIQYGQDGSMGRLSASNDWEFEIIADEVWATLDVIKLRSPA